METKTCSSCNITKPVSEFYSNKAVRADKVYRYPRGKCKLCEKERKRNSPAQKAYYKRYFSSDRGKEIQRKYRLSKKGQIVEKRHREKVKQKREQEKERKKFESLLLTADLPGEVVAPVMREVLDFYDAEHLAEILEVPSSSIYRIAKGEIKKRTVDFCDVLCMLSVQTNLNDLYEEAQKWAELNPDANWPLAYDPNKKKRKRKKKVATTS